SPREITKNVSDMNMGPWISSLIAETLQSTKLADDDFVGKKGDIVTMSELIHAMAYYAAAMGYSPSWELSPSPTFDDFERRPGVYKAMSKKIENWSMANSRKKLSSAKKVMRVRVNDKATKVCGRPDSLGVFVSDADDMASIYTDPDYKRVVCKLHKLAVYPQDNPRFYIHMVYRYYMNDFHKHLANMDKVIRFPSIKRIMDIQLPLNCAVSIPSEFRMFVEAAKGNKVFAVTLPVPSKTTADEVVYGYDFESAVPWVPVMRARIFEMFVELRSSASPPLIRQIYPKYLVKGDAGCTKGTKAIVDALARSIGIENLAQTLHSFRHIGPQTRELIVLWLDPRIADIFTRYNNHQFLAEGEQLPERVGFFAQESVRGVFRIVAATMPSFCNDIYTGLKISYVAMDAFAEYCTTKIFIIFKKRGEGVWRNFVIDMQKISSILHAWNRKGEVDQFMQEHRSTDEYLRSVLDQLA
ncbi:unnamed protein product, partial [Sphacelaria rigidula]